MNILKGHSFGTWSPSHFCFYDERKANLGPDQPLQRILSAYAWWPCHGKKYAKITVNVSVKSLSHVVLKYLPQRYVLVRYEDLVSKRHTGTTLKELYEFMAIPFDLESQNSKLEGLSHESQPTGFYGLLRGKDFDPNHWTKELTREVK